jgi:tetratricopeptide (TPR) repeat protein
MTSDRETIQADLRKGIALFQQGRFVEAETIITRAHQQQPDNFDALHILGILALQGTRPGRGVELISKALAIRGDSAPAHNNLGNGFRALARPQAALASYDKAIALKPHFVEAYNNRGNVLIDLRRPNDARASFDMAIALNPSFAEAYSNRANALLKLKRTDEALASCEKAMSLQPHFAEAYVIRGDVLLEQSLAEEALTSFDKAISLKPHFAEAHVGRGNALLRLNRAEEALVSYNNGIALKPDFPAALNSRGNALRDLKQVQEALASYNKAILLRSDFAEAYNNRGKALMDLRLADLALESYNKAIALIPDYAAAYNNRGNALAELGRSVEALESFDKVIALQPDNAKAYNNRGNALLDLKRLDATLESYDRAIALNSDYAEAHWNQSFALLLMGRFERGLREYEWRKRRADSPATRSFPPQLLWTGAQDISNKILFIYCEQGLGDTIQFCRYARLAEIMGAKVILSAQDALARLIKTLSPTIEIINFSEVPSNFDYHIPLLSMPLAFNTDHNNIPAEVPYLQADRERVESWRDRIGGAGIKIGIGWQGNKLTPADIGRSFPVWHFEAISRIPNVRLISLQKSVGIDQLTHLPTGMKVETISDELDEGPDAFIDTAAVMESLDLVITSDTAIAHLAGALGRPTWVALKYAPDWRWLLDRSDSPWYPTLRLFRQASHNNWASAFAEIESRLIETLSETCRGR